MPEGPRWTGSPSAVPEHEPQDQVGNEAKGEDKRPVAKGDGGPFACPFAKEDPAGHEEVDGPCTTSAGFTSMSLLK